MKGKEFMLIKHLLLIIQQIIKVIGLLNLIITKEYLQIQIRAVLKEYSEEEFLVYITPVDLTRIKLEEKNDIPWIYRGIPVIVIFVVFYYFL